MSRPLALLIPTALAACVSACATAPPAVPAGATAGFDLSAPAAASSEPLAEPGAWTTGIRGPVSALPASKPAEKVFAGLSDRHLSVLVGVRLMDDDEWDPVEDQLASGVQLDGSNPSTGHGYEVGMTASYDYDEDGAVDVWGSTYDMYGGYRYTFHPEAEDIHPYLAAGLAVIYGYVELDGPGSNPDDDDASGAAYVRAGVGFDLSERLRLGIDYRHLFLSDVDILGIDDADFDQVMLTLGFAF